MSNHLPKYAVATVAVLSLALLTPVVPAAAMPASTSPAHVVVTAAAASPQILIPTKKEAKSKTKAVAAFKRWIKYWNVQDWDGQYARLVDEQKALFTEQEFYDNHDDVDFAKVSWVKTVRTKKTSTDIPGTDIVMPATKVTARLKVQGQKFTLSMHCYYQGGKWRWALNQDGVDEILAARADSVEVDPNA